MCLASTTDKQAKIRTAVGNAKLPEGSTAAQLSCYMQDLWEIWKLDVLNHDARVAVAAFLTVRLRRHPRHVVFGKPHC